MANGIAVSAQHRRSILSDKLGTAALFLGLCAIAFMFIGLQGFRAEKGNHLPEDRAVAGGFDIMRRHERKPQQIVGAECAQSTPGRWMPPVQHISLFELVSSRFEQVLPRKFGSCMDIRH